MKGVKFRVRGSVGVRFRVRGSVGNRFRVGVSVRNRFREKYCPFLTTSGQPSTSHSPLLREKPVIVNSRLYFISHIIYSISDSRSIFSAESLAPPSMCGMDWSSLERKLEQAAEEEARRKVGLWEESLSSQNVCCFFVLTLICYCS